MNKNKLNERIDNIIERLDRLFTKIEFEKLSSDNVNKFILEVLDNLEDSVKKYEDNYEKIKNQKEYDCIFFQDI